jgi:hypothetical protein
VSCFQVQMRRVGKAAGRECVRKRAHHSNRRTTTAVILRSALLRASRRMEAGTCGPSFEARRQMRRAPLAITAKPLRGDDGGVCADRSWWAHRRTHSRPAPLPTLRAG